MLRALTIAALLAILPSMSGQAPVLLHIKITLTDGSSPPVAVPRHALLISDDPATSVPRRVVTAADGTVDVSLSPGRYTVESDQPTTFGGKGYQWTRRVDLTGGRTVTLELTAQNAEVGAAPAVVEARPSAPLPEDEALLLLPKWKDSVVAVWTPTSRASGFVADASGLVVTNRRVIGNASTVEVQLTPAVKVAGQVLAVDEARDIAVLGIDPSIITSVRPVPVDCAAGPQALFVQGQEVVALGAPLRAPKNVSIGEVTHVEALATVANFAVAPGSSGGPVFSTTGDLLGMSSTADLDAQGRGGEHRVVPVGDICSVMNAAQKARPAAARPTATRLPVESLRALPADALEAVMRGRAGRTAPYTMSSADFDIAFLTPPMVYGAQHAPPPPTNRFGVLEPEAAQSRHVDATDFGDWSDYFEDVPPVLVIRVTPKFEEGFWTKFGRSAVYTQGVALPPIKRFKPGFSRLRVFCGIVEVVPIHPFVLEQRVSETDAIREGLYVFDPFALGPQCATVKLGLSSEKAPGKEELRTVDPAVIQRIWQDFAAYRAFEASGRGGIAQRLR